jgi:hypothetical protein
VIGKWFGWLRPAENEDPTDEPPTAMAVPAQRATRAASTLKAVPADKSAKGFDPYNSGAFKRKNAWEKVPRL